MKIKMDFVLQPVVKRSGFMASSASILPLWHIDGKMHPRPRKAADTLLPNTSSEQSTGTEEGSTQQLIIHLPS